jgi:hypothetical protein
MTFDPMQRFTSTQDDIAFNYFLLDSSEKSTVNLPNILDNFSSMDVELGPLPLIRIAAGMFNKVKPH